MKSFLYKIRKARWPKLVILCYHRIENYITDPVKITVSKKNFSKQISFLKEYAEIINPDQLFESLENRKHLPKRSVLLTFDDGYSSYEETMEFLKKKSVPAIFFISLRKKNFWWDILSKLLLKNQHLKNNEFDKINNFLAELGYQFKIEQHIELDLLSKLRTWDVTESHFPFKRNRAFYLLAKIFEEIDHYEQPNLLKTITSLSTEKRDFSYLHKKDLLEYHKIGSHTINHFNLSKLSYENQNKEVQVGRKGLESIIGKRVKIFAYPFGGKIHYNKDTLDIVKKNFNFAFSNFEGLVHKDSNNYELPRFLVRDWGIDKFILKVKSFFRGQ